MSCYPPHSTSWFSVTPQPTRMPAQPAPATSSRSAAAWSQRSGRRVRLDRKTVPSDVAAPSMPTLVESLRSDPDIRDSVSDADVILLAIGSGDVALTAATSCRAERQAPCSLRPPSRDSAKAWSHGPSRPDTIRRAPPGDPSRRHSTTNLRPTPAEPCRANRLSSRRRSCRRLRQRVRPGAHRRADALRWNQIRPSTPPTDTTRPRHRRSTTHRHRHHLMMPKPAMRHAVADLRIPHSCSSTSAGRVFDGVVSPGFARVHAAQPGSHGPAATGLGQVRTHGPSQRTAFDSSSRIGSCAEGLCRLSPCRYEFEASEMRI